MIKMVHALEVFPISNENQTELEVGNENCKEEIFESFLCLLNGEIVTIDNNSLDELKEIINKYKAKNVRMLVEFYTAVIDESKSGNLKFVFIKRSLEPYSENKENSVITELTDTIKKLLNIMEDQTDNDLNTEESVNNTVKRVKSDSRSEVFVKVVIKVLYNALDLKMPKELENATNYDDTYGFTSLHVCVLINNPDLFKKMLILDPSLEKPDKNGQYPEHYIAYSPLSNPEFILILKSMSFDIGHKDNNGQTPVVISIKNNSNQLLPFLMRKEDGIVVDGDRNTEFHIAAMARNIMALDAISKLYPNALLQTNRRGYSPLDMLSRDTSAKDNEETIDTLCFILQSAPEQIGENALRLIQKREKGLDPQIVIHVFTKLKNFNINQRAKGTTFLIAMLKAQYPLKSIAEAIDHLGARIDVAGKLGEYPIHIAAKHAHIDILEFIINKYPDEVGRRSNDGSSVFIYASVSPDLEQGYLKFELLSKSWEDLIFEPNNKRATPLMAAASMGNYKIVHCIRMIYEKEKKSNEKNEKWKNYLNMKNHVGCTALHFACQKASKEVIEELAEFHDLINPNIPNIDGDYPFHLVGGTDSAHRDAQIAFLSSGWEIKRSTNKRGRDPLANLHSDSLSLFFRSTKGNSEQFGANDPNYLSTAKSEPPKLGSYKQMNIDSSYLSTAKSEPPKLRDHKQRSLGMESSSIPSTAHSEINPYEKKSKKSINRDIIPKLFFPEISKRIHDGTLEIEDIEDLSENEVNGVDSSTGMNLLMIAVSNKQNQYINPLMCKSHTLALVGDAKNRTALYISIQQNNLDGVKELVRLLDVDELERVSVTSIKQRGLTAVHLAAKHGIEYLRALQEKWVYIFETPCQNSTGQCPLSYAIVSNNESTAKYIAQNLGGKVVDQLKEPDNDGFTPLDYSVKFGMRSVVELILAQSESARVNPNIIISTPKDKLSAVAPVLFGRLRGAPLDLRDRILCSVAAKDDIQLFDSAKDMIANECDRSDESLLIHFAKSEIPNSHFCISIILAKFDRMDRLNRSVIAAVNEAIHVSNQNSKHRLKLEKFLSKHEKK